MRQNTTFYIMFCEIIHELLIHQVETEHSTFYIMYCEILHELLIHHRTEHNILYNVLWDYTWTINTSGWDRTQHSI